MIRQIAVVALAAASTALLFAPAHAAAEDRWDLCANEYWAHHDNGHALGIAPSDAELMIADIATSVGLNASSVTIVPCERITRAKSFYADGVSVQIRAGEYIFYNPNWLREVVGENLPTSGVQAEMILGHELGHLVARDFTAPRNLLPQEQRELEADRFAGCAVARGHSPDWPALDNILRRLRPLQPIAGYPSQDQSLAAARQGFETCGRAAPVAVANTNSNGARLLTAAAHGDLDGVMRYLNPETFNARAAEGLNALMVAADQCYPRVGRYILSVAGPMHLDVNATNDWHDTALAISLGTDSNLRALGIVRPRCAELSPDIRAAGGH